MVSPYKNKNISEWKSITEKLVDTFPINKRELKKFTEDAFKDYLNIKYTHFGISY